MKTLTYRGTTYKQAFGSVLKPLTTDELADLKQSIARFGIRMPVTTNDKDEVIDGWHRLEIAVENCIDCPMATRPSDELDKELAWELNAARRQITPADMVAARNARLARVAAARADGQSIRTIAENVGVSRTQAARDVKAVESSVENEPKKDGDTGQGLTSTAPGGTVESEPSKNGVHEPPKVTGKDGKKRSSNAAPRILCSRCKRIGKPVRACEGCTAARTEAKREKTAEKAKKKAEAAAERAKKAEPVDPAGIAIPERLKPVFGEKSQFSQSAAKLDQLKELVTEIIKGPAGHYLKNRLPNFETAIGNLKSQIDAGKPSHVCPYCQAKKKDCDSCSGAGWVPKHVFDTSPAGKAAKSANEKAGAK